MPQAAAGFAGIVTARPSSCFEMAVFGGAAWSVRDFSDDRPSFFPFVDERSPMLAQRANREDDKSKYIGRSPGGFFGESELLSKNPSSSRINLPIIDGCRTTSVSKGSSVSNSLLHVDCLPKRSSLKPVLVESK